MFAEYVINSTSTYLPNLYNYFTLETDASYYRSIKRIRNYIQLLMLVILCQLMHPIMPVPI